MKFRVDSMEEAQSRMEQALSRIDELESSSAASAVSGETAFCYEKKIGNAVYEVCISVSAKGAAS